MRLGTSDALGISQPIPSFMQHPFVKRFSFLVSGLFAVAASTMTSHAITVVNGDFESAFLAGWSGGGPDQQYITPGQTGQGLEIGGLGGAIPNSIHQVIDGFTVNNCYTISFALASQWAGGSGAQAELSFLSGSPTAASIFTAPAVAGFGQWMTFSYNFMASSSSVDVQFKEILNGFDDVAIDNVSISGGSCCSLPDGGMTIAMLGLGLGGIAAARRKLS